MVYRDATETLRNKKKVFEEELGEILYHIESEWVELKVIWKQFEDLFCSGPERVNLLNEVSGRFFYTVDRVLLDATILSVCRLTDPIRSAGKTNLSISQLPPHINNKDTRKHADILVCQAMEAARFHRDWRNRKISHNDFDLKMGTAKPLEAATIKKMRISIAAIHSVLNYIYNNINNSELCDEVADDGSNADSLLLYLYDGAEGEKKRRKERIAGEREYPEWLKC